MELTGEQLIPLPQQQVWEALNDPAILKACIPGCESMEKTSDNEYAVAMMAAVGPVKARFAGKLKLSDINPPTSYALAFEGSGGAAGFGKGGAKVSLLPVGQATRLSYTATATVGGRLAQIGARLIDGVAKKMADDFFARFNATVAPAATPTTAATAATSTSEASAIAAAIVPAVKTRVPTWAWVLGAVVIAVILFYALRAR